MGFPRGDDPYGRILPLNRRKAVADSSRLCCRFVPTLLPIRPGAPADSSRRTLPIRPEDFPDFAP
jgi:hypothetical protein